MSGEQRKKTKDYRDLIVWQKGIGLTKTVYELTSQFPPEERFALIAPIRRAAVSVPSNIAEGQARHMTGEFIQHISPAEGSLAELDTQLVLTQEFRYCNSQQLAELHESVSELRRMLNALRRTLRGRRQ